MGRIKGVEKEIYSLLKMLFVLILTTLCSLFTADIGVGKESIIMVFFMGVLFIPILTNGYRYGLISSAVSVALFNFFFTEPKFTFLIYNEMDVLLLLFFLVTAVVSGTITSRLQKQMKASYESEKTVRLLYEIAEGFLHVTGKRNIILLGIQYIFDNTGFTSSVVIDGEEQAYWNEQYPKTEETGQKILIKGVTHTIGFVVLYCGDKTLTFWQDLVVKTVAAQLGTTLDRENNYTERENIRIAMEREHLRSTLLRSVAHDLRSPLTALTGASSLLADRFDELLPEEQKKLAVDISEEIIWLTNLVENILNMTRIGEGKLVVYKEDEVIDDVVNETLSHMARLLKNRKLEISLPDEVIFLKMDGKLIVQVLVNLLDNAVKHTLGDGIIGLKIYRKERGIIFEVSDNGSGIDTELMGKLFDKFTTGKNRIADGKRGVGLGLAICKAIIHAHGGEIWVEKENKIGTCISFFLPLEDAESMQI